MSTENGSEEFGADLPKKNFQKVSVPQPASNPALTPEVSYGELIKKELEEIKAIKAELLAEKEKLSSPTVSSGGTFAQELALAIKTAMNNGTTQPDRPEEPEDDGDFDENGTSFYCFCSAYFIGSDTRRGREVFPPKRGTNSDGLIEFKFEVSKEIKSGRQSDVIVISKFVSHSKRVTEWLRSDTRFGNQFFERLPARLDMGTVSYARRMSQNLAYLKEFANAQLVTKCKEFGVAVSEDADQMRSAIAMEITRREFTVTSDGRMLPISQVQDYETKFADADKAEMLSAREAKSNVSKDPNKVVYTGEEANA